MKKEGFVYILTNSNNTVLYTGVTSNLIQRVHQHKTGIFKDSFTSKYQITKLVFFERFDTITEAIRREKQIKAGSRKKKVDLINHFNPDWKELSPLSSMY
jgi:putative endonuclease